jgi:hypothetical protein
MQSESVLLIVCANDQQQDFGDLDIGYAFQQSSDANVRFSSSVVVEHPLPGLEMIDSPTRLNEMGSMGSFVTVETFTIKNIVQEPVRLMAAGTATKLKRFYRTSWRGLSRRAVAHAAGSEMQQNRITVGFMKIGLICTIISHEAHKSLL